MQEFVSEHNYDIDITNIDDHLLTVCKNPKCPNYALMQIPMEIMNDGDNK